MNIKSVFQLQSLKLINKIINNIILIAMLLYLFKIKIIQSKTKGIDLKFISNLINTIRIELSKTEDKSFYINKLSI